MTHAELSAALRRMPLGGRLDLPYAALEIALALKRSALEGRSTLYAFADIHKCRLEWNDAADGVAFIKRPGIIF